MGGLLLFNFSTWLLLLALSCRLLDLTDATSRPAEHQTIVMQGGGDDVGSHMRTWPRSDVLRPGQQQVRHIVSPVATAAPNRQPDGLQRPHKVSAAAQAAGEQQRQRRVVAKPAHSADDAAAAAKQRTSAVAAASRHLQQYDPGVQEDPVYSDVPASDLLTLDSILAAARDAFAMFEPQIMPHPHQLPYLEPANTIQQQQQQQQRYVPARSRALGGMASRSTPGSGTIALVVGFSSAPEDADIPLRLPVSPRSFNLTVTSLSDPGAQACTHNKLPYLDQEVTCHNMAPGTKWLATLVDADSDDLVLASVNFTVTNTMVSQDVPVELGQLTVETSFDQLAWAGMYYPRPRHSTSTIIIHAIIVGAQVAVYTRQGGQEVLWDVQWTGSEGTTTFFLVPGARSVYWANMSVGETVLRTTPITLDAPLSVYQDDSIASAPLPQLQQQQLTAVPQLLCTGEVEDVRGDAGTFPQSLSPLEANNKSVYHPKGFTCRWELTPDQPDVLLSVDYRGLLPDESITLELAPNNVIRLEPPEGGPGAVFQASIWVEHSILVSFQTTRTSTSRVGAFSISWTSVSSGSRGLLDSKTMVVVLSCVSAAGALLAACCFYFVCCGRRRRRAGAAVVDGDDGGVGRGGLVRVPSAVRSLLPSKPYQPPEANPLPGASTEPDCCSICLVDLEAGEDVTVLPCMHFYHKDCIGSWLKRNCTCPLCKNNVLEAFKVQQFEARQARRNRRAARAAAAAAAGGAAVVPAALSPGGTALSSGRSTPSGSGSEAAAAASIHHQQQHIELTALQSTSTPAAAAAAWSGSSRSPSPWAAWEGLRAPSPAAAILPAEAAGGDAVVALSMLPNGGRALRLPPVALQQHHPLVTAPHGVAASTGSWLLSLSPGSAAAGGGGADSEAANPSAAALPPLAIPPSPSASMLSLQSGTVLATPEDFAPAAAAAAAHFSEVAAASRQHSTSPRGIAGAAASAAQASVAVLRTSSRNLGRRLQGMLSPSSAAPAAADAPSSSSAAATSSSQQVASPQRPPSSSSSARSSPLPPRGVSPGAFVAAPPRVAVSIYAYAGHPSGSDEEAGLSEESQEQQQVLTPPGSVARTASHQAITVLSLPGSVEGGGTAEVQHQ